MVGSRAGDVSADDATALDCRPGPRRRMGLTRRHRPGDDGGPATAARRRRLRLRLVSSMLGRSLGLADSHLCA
jgi:hypothetical protein